VNALSRFRGKPAPVKDVSPTVVPRGILKYLKPSDIKRSPNNPRMLFDPEPMHDLRESIRQHGVLVPITVFELPGQDKYAILDGERRYRCVLELVKEIPSLTIPANIVEPPNAIAQILYMFSIHNFREQWELMPTALSLQTVMAELNERDTDVLSKLTGLSSAQIERCKKLLSFSRRFQDMSLDPDPKTRIPSNFWIEAHPVIEQCEKVLPDLAEQLGRDGITQKLVEKYRAKCIKSVIHFRLIMQAFVLNADDQAKLVEVTDRLWAYISDVQMETRRAFDEFVRDRGRVRNAISVCQDFRTKLGRAKLDYEIDDKDQLISALQDVMVYVESLLQKLEGRDAPEDQGEKDAEEGK
jgi:ParB family transcriptional regulator, chromosome partitioning protein